VEPQNYEAEVRKALTDPENGRPDAEILLSELHPSVAIRSKRRFVATPSFSTYRALFEEPNASPACVELN